MAWLAALAWESWQRRRLESRLAHLVDLLGVTSDPEMLTESLRSAVRDPDLRLAYWAPSRQGYVDWRGARQPQARNPGPDRRVTTVARRRPADRRHRPLASRRRPPTRTSVGPALRLAMENAQLRAAALAELDELNRSRVRVVQRGELERRRLERNLHDGAQQRVVSLALLVRVFVGRASPADHQAGRRAEALTRTLVEELRRVARGIYPAVLADAGLVGAVVDLAERVERPAGRRRPVPGGSISGHGRDDCVPSRPCRHRGRTQSRCDLRRREWPAGGRRGCGSASRTTRADGRPDCSWRPSSPIRSSALGGTLETNGAPGRRRVEVVLPCVS